MTPAPDDVGNRVRRPRVRDVSADLDQSALADLLREIGVPTGVPAVVLVGGAGGLTIEQLRPCQELVGFGVLPAVAEAGAVLIDGGTDSGVMAIAGRARESSGSGFTHVGVVAGGTVRSPEGSAAVENPADLEANHTHILVVPGDTWGEETPWISAVATAVATGAPSVTVLVNGGNVAFRDVRQSLEVGRPVIVLSGTGRSADQITDAVLGESADPAAVALAASPLVTVVSPDTDAVRSAIAAALDT